MSVIRRTRARRVNALLAIKRAALALAASTTALLLLVGCASALESVGDAMPVSQGEFEEVIQSVNDTVEGSSSGNAWLTGAGGLGVLGLAALVTRRMILRAINRYDEAPFEGPNGEQVNEAALVAGALSNTRQDPSSKS